MHTKMPRYVESCCRSWSILHYRAHQGVDNHQTSLATVLRATNMVVIAALHSGKKSTTFHWCVGLSGAGSCGDDQRLVNGQRPIHMVHGAMEQSKAGVVICIPNSVGTRYVSGNCWSSTSLMFSKESLHPFALCSVRLDTALIHVIHQPVNQDRHILPKTGRRETPNG